MVIDKNAKLNITEEKKKIFELWRHPYSDNQ